MTNALKNIAAGFIILSALGVLIAAAYKVGYSDTAKVKPEKPIPNPFQYIGGQTDLHAYVLTDPATGQRFIVTRTYHGVAIAPADAPLNITKN